MKRRFAHAALSLLGIGSAIALAIPARAQTLGGATQLGAPREREPRALPGSAVPFQPRQGEPLNGLTPEELERFATGKVVFGTNLTSTEGLGPIFNDLSCGACHSQPRSGGASPTTVTRFGRAAQGMMPFDPLEHLGGSLQQVQTIDAGCTEVVPPEADVTAQRVTPITFGAGLLEAIDDADILALEANPPPGVSGVARMVQPLEGGPMRPGRFGWKGGVATVLTFSADASLNEMGLTNAFLMVENAPNGDQVALAQCDMVPEPEDFPDPGGLTKIERFTDFQRFLAPPPQTPRRGMTGEALFEQIGCGACHVTGGYVTAAAPEAALSFVAIKPYSDFLLHDMGSLGDEIVDGIADEQSMQTRALWGLQSRGSMLHDGRATGGTFSDNVNDAIAEHDGEAAASRIAYRSLTSTQKAQVVAFLQSLGQAEFDWERDHDVDEFDWFFIEQTFTGPGSFLSPDDFASISDVDADGDFDLADFSAVQRAYTGQF